MTTQAVSVNLNPGTAKQTPQQSGDGGFSDFLGNVNSRSVEKRQAGCAGSDNSSHSFGQTREQGQARSDFRYTEKASQSCDSQKMSVQRESVSYDSTAVKAVSGSDADFDPIAAGEILDEAVSAVMESISMAENQPTAEETVTMLVQVLRKLNKDSEKAQTDAVLKALMKVVDAMAKNGETDAGTASAAAVLFGIAPDDKKTEELPETGLAQTFTFSYTEKHTEIAMLSFEETITVAAPMQEMPAENTGLPANDAAAGQQPDSDVQNPQDVRIMSGVNPKTITDDMRENDTAESSEQAQENKPAQIPIDVMPFGFDAAEDPSAGNGESIDEDEKNEGHPEFIREALRTETPPERRTEKHRDKPSAVRIANIKGSGEEEETGAEASSGFGTQELTAQQITLTGEAVQGSVPEDTVSQTAGTVQTVVNNAAGMIRDSAQDSTTAAESGIEFDLPETQETGEPVNEAALFLDELVSRAKKELGLTEARITVSDDSRQDNTAALNAGANELQFRLGSSDKTSELDHILGGESRQQAQRPENENQTVTYDAVHMASQLMDDRTQVSVQMRPEPEQPIQEQRPPEIQTAQEILDRMDALRTNGHTEFTMVLNPESLGKITVKLVSAGAKVAVEISAENPETRQLLEARAGNMESVLKSSGVELEKYQVVESGEDTQQLMQQDYDGSSKNPYSGRQTDDDSSDDDDGDNFFDILQSI